MRKKGENDQCTFKFQTQTYLSVTSTERTLSLVLRHDVTAPPGTRGGRAGYPVTFLLLPSQRPAEIHRVRKHMQRRMKMGKHRSPPPQTPDDRKLQIVGITAAMRKKQLC